MATFTSNYAWTKPAGSDPVDIGVLNNNLDSQDGIMHDAFLNMADPFSESSTYAVGAIVLYGTKTYKCHTAVTTAGSWTGAANWDEHKISALVLDNAPTDGSNNPVKSDGIYDSEKDIYAVMGQMGAKNFNIFPYKNGGAGDVWSTNGIDFTVNADGTIDVNGTATADAFFRCGISTDDSNPIFLVAGTTYILSGSGSSNIDVRLRNSSNAGVANAGIEDAEYECTTSGKYYILVIAKNGKTISHYTVKPMIRLASDTDDTYQPYAKTNKQLTDAVSSILTEQDSIETELDTKADKTATASGETLALVPTSEGRALLHTAYGMSTQDGTPTPSTPVDIVSAKANFISTDGVNTQNVTTDLTLRAIEVTSSDAYNLVRDGKYYIADTLDYSEDNRWTVTRRVGVSKASDVTWQGINVNGYNINTTQLNNLIATTSQNPILTKYFQPTHALSAVPENSIAKFTNVNISTTVVSGATTDAERKTMWDTWLSTHDFDIVYILAIPTTEAITTAQALALLGLKTYDESTTISSQAEPSCTVAIEYAKERLGALALTAYNTAKGNDLRITALES